MSEKGCGSDVIFNQNKIIIINTVKLERAVVQYTLGRNMGS